jgi:hypothetical protein
VVTVGGVSRETGHELIVYELETPMHGGSREVLKLECVTAHGVTTYKGHVQQASKKRSVTVDANGQLVKPE